MLDGFAKKSLVHLVVDLKNYGVLTCSHSSIPVANAVSQGLLNTSVQNIFLPEKVEYFKNYNTQAIEREKNCLVVKQTPFALTAGEGNIGRSVDRTANKRLFDVVEMTSEEVTEEWIKRRHLANLRLQSLVLLESKLERYMVRLKSFSGDEMFVPFMAQELNQCDMPLGVFTPAIIEWANIAGVDPATAVNELSMKVRSYLLSISRLNAIWVKYVNKINALETLAEMTSCLNDSLEMELRSGAQ